MFESLRQAVAHGLAVCLVAVVGSIVIISTPAEAHCPGGGGTTYAAGKRSATSYGIISSIEWTQGNVCSSGVSHSVTVCKTGTCPGWVQSGWRYYAGYSEPKGYCEYKASSGTYYSLTEYAISHATHSYEMRTVESSGGASWSCRIDGTSKRAVSTWTLGFGNGSYMVAQGEAHAAHVQIGKVAPLKLAFTGLKYRPTSTTLSDMNPTTSTSSPYGIDKPSNSSIRMWTNAH